MGGNTSSLPNPQCTYLENDNDGESKIMRALTGSEDGFIDSFRGEQIVRNLFVNTVDKFGDRPFYGVRQVNAEGEAGEFEFETYNSVNTKVNNLAAGLVAMGIEKSSTVGLYSINRPEWVTGELACYRQGYISIPLYDTLGPEAVEYITSQAEINCVICSADKVDRLLEVAGKSEYPRYIIQMEDMTEEQKKAAEDSPATLTDLKTVMADGEKNPVDQDPVESPDDIATICYTSGTTGNPKGVVLTNKSLCGMLGGVDHHGVTLYETDVHVSYLPLAHVFERAIMTMVYGAGASVGFFQGQIPLLFDDIHTLKPTIFPSVPRLYNRLFDKINMAFNSAGGVKKFLFDAGMDSKKDGLANGSVESGFWDAILFNKIKEKLGGRVRLAITGSAPLSAEVQDFLQICFCCPVLQGYGLTETCAASTLSRLDDTASGHVGVPLPCCEVVLRDVPEMNYLSTDENPRGEVLIRGVNVFQGYYKNPEKTAEDLEDNGWFHTGDIGMFRPNGVLQIIDRKKNIFKLQHGEYVAAEYVEGVLGKNPYVLQIFIYGDSFKAKLVAVVVPDPEVLLPWADENNIEGADNIETLCQSEEVKKFIAAEIKQTGQDASLKGFEFPHALHLEPEPFSVENNILTPTFKLKRPIAKEVYQEQIEEMYAALDEAEAKKNAAK